MAKRKKKNSWLILIAVSLLIVVAAGVYYFRLLPGRNFIRHTAFGISIPENYLIHGIDVSRYQSVISWERVKQMNADSIRIGFAFIKATEGIELVDKQFKRNWTEAKKQGIPRGAYHFFIPGKSGITQATKFMSVVKLSKGDLPPVLDVEEAYGASESVVRKGVAEWLVLAERKYKVKPILYTNIHFYKKYLSGHFDQYPLWIAHYKVKTKPRIKRDWIFWQHSETAKVYGINSPVDFNVFYGDSLAFKELLIK